MMRSHYYLQEKFNTGISIKTVCFKKNVKNHGFLFHCNIREDTMLVIVYVVARQITCISSTCGSKLASTWNKRQDKLNQYQYKGEYRHSVYWTILGSYKNWNIIQCIYIYLLKIKNNTKQAIVT